MNNKQNRPVTIKIKKRQNPLLWSILLLSLLFSAVGCSSNTEENGTKNTEKMLQPPPAYSAEFADFKEVPVKCNPAVEPYRLQPGLQNVVNAEMFQFSPAAKDLLIKNGFVVIPNDHIREYFMLYEANRYQPVPSFITTDSMLHNYHLFFNHLLRVIEKEKLARELTQLSKEMLSQAEEQYRNLKNTGWENAAKRNVGFFAVACKLLDPNVTVPAAVKEEVEKELALIESHQGINLSPVMNTGSSSQSENNLQEDYSQYIPRGHYNDSELLKTYFKAMMWYGRLTFRSANEDETRSAVLITLSLDNAQNRAKWDKIYQVTSFFVGKSDDPSCKEYRELLDNIYGEDSGLQTVIDQQNKWSEFLEALDKLEPPVINSIPVFDVSVQPDREKAIKGFRFMGQRFTLDAAVFQRLVYREVKENEQNERRMLPKALDIPATMGSGEAYKILHSMGETGYPGYADNMTKLQKYISGLSKETWTQSLYWGWLYSLRTLIGEEREGYPSFMQNAAWIRKELNTFLGSWTELKHDTILYAKQVYAEMGGGIDGIDDRGYVEPNPELYARLASLVAMTREGLLSRDLIGERDQASLDRMETLALKLKTISEKELSNTALTGEEYDLIRSYGGQLEHFWLEALRDEGIDHRSALHDRPAALVADVATDPNGRVLEEATGYVFEIFAVVPVDGTLRIAKGGVYSHYEFPWPLNDRLTDKKWHQMLDSGNAPPLPSWTGDFMAPAPAQ